jgi:hypothetical protein
MQINLDPSSLSSDLTTSIYTLAVGQWIGNGDAHEILDRKKKESKE